MAKGRQSSNREIRKPKIAKPKPAVQVSPFDRPMDGATAKKGGTGKRPR